MVGPGYRPAQHVAARDTVRCPGPTTTLKNVTHKIHCEDCSLERKRISLDLFMSFSAQNTFSHSDPRNTSMDHAVRVEVIFVIQVERMFTPDDLWFGLDTYDSLYEYIYIHMSITVYLDP